MKAVRKNEKRKRNKAQLIRKLDALRETVNALRADVGARPLSSRAKDPVVDVRAEMPAEERIESAPALAREEDVIVSAPQQESVVAPIQPVPVPSSAEALMEGSHLQSSVKPPLEPAPALPLSNEGLERAWQQCIDTLDDDACILDMSGTIVAGNRSMRERFRGHNDNPIGRHYRLAFYGSETLNAESPWDAVLSGALSTQVETFLPAMKGWFSVSCYALHTPEGDQWGVMSIVKVITEREQREELIRKFSQGSLASGGVMFFRELVLSLAETLDVSCAYIAELRKDNDGTIRTLAVCTHGEIADNFEFPLANTPCAEVLKRNRGTIVTGAGPQLAHITALGRLDLDSYVGLPLLDSANRAVGIMVVMNQGPIVNPQLVETTLRLVAVRVASELERKQAEDTLQESEERYRTLAESTYDLICKTTIHGEYLYLSPNYKDVLGDDPRELRGTNIFDHIHPEDRAAVRDEFEKARIHTSSVTVVHRYHPRHRDWRWFETDECQWFESSGRLVQFAGGTSGWVIVSRDITERKAMEADLLNAKKLESIGLLAGGIAHDFNNILTAVYGNVVMAKVDGLPRDKLEKRLAEAENACLRAQELTKKMLTFAKGGEPVRIAVPARALIRQAVKRAVLRDDITCKFTFPEKLRDVLADEGQMTQVLQNVVTNACEAMPLGGVLTVAAENIDIGANEKLLMKEGSYVKVSIQDQGLGISQANLQNVVDPFFTTRPPQSGLGLAVAYSIMNSHGGGITIDSELGIGTIVTLYLPIGSQVAALSRRGSEQGLESEDSVQESKGAVLVVEDEEPICELLRQTMAHLGYTVEFAHNGQEGINRYRQAKTSGRPFQAVLVDLVMPGGMGGKEMIEQLLAFDPGIKAIVSSGYSSDPVIAEYQKYGFKGAIAKPYKISDLSAVLHDVIYGSPADTY